MLKTMLATGLCVSALTMSATAQLELTTNGGFEAGDISDWVEFPTGGSSFFNVTGDSSSGAFAGNVFNDVDGSAYIVKQANLGIGQVSPGDTVTISFDAKGSGEAGGVHFAEFFSEIDGGGTSSSAILGGAPLFPLSDAYTTYNFTTTAGADVSAGVTLQFVAATGANIGSTSTLFIDNVSVSIVPEPTTAALAGLGGLAMLGRRRR